MAPETTLGEQLDRGSADSSRTAGHKCCLARQRNHVSPRRSPNVALVLSAKAKKATVSLQIAAPNRLPGKPLPIVSDEGRRRLDSSAVGLIAAPAGFILEPKRHRSSRTLAQKEVVTQPLRCRLKAAKRAGGLARGGHKIAEQRLRQRFGLDHSLGVPLHPRDPVCVARPFHGFDHTIGRARYDAEIAAGLEDGLVMRAIHLQLDRTGHLR